MLFKQACTLLLVFAKQLAEGKLAPAALAIDVDLQQSLIRRRIAHLHFALLPIESCGEAETPA